ncbi:caspase family protein [Maliponia aquimaris]|uniref:WD domain, G-beta repeat n=1 Tax=Maliponia aquimaris TaxID=1673631 RepID=A0A238K7H1_9RHOB|nr:caspase family protein [Maliponia aquimaris]SMX38743.1 WD domain, G-beta repeat [Maliponia aquimaris]
MKRSLLLASLALAVMVGALTGPGRAEDAPVVLSGHKGALEDAEFSPDGLHVLTGSADWTAELWELSSARSLLILDAHLHRVSGVAFSPDGTRAVTVGADGALRLWDLATGDEVLTVEREGQRFTSVAFSPNGRQAVTGGNDGTARLWDLRSGAQLRVFEGHTDAVTDIALSPDGTRLLTGSTDRTARLWDVASGAALKSFAGHEALILAVAYAPDGKQVLTGSWDKTARLWDVDTGRELRRFPGHDAAIRAVAFSPDGALVLTGEWNNTAWLWNTATGEEIRSFTGHTASIDAVAFAPDGRRLLTGSWDGTAMIWPVPEAYWPQGAPQDAPRVAVATPPPRPAPAKPAAPPPRPVSRPDMLVVVIGNRTYAEAPPVSYARNDAEAIARYFETTLGVPPENVIVELDLTSIGMNRLFGTEDLPEGRLARRARFVDEIVVYYSGHGVPVFRAEGLPIGYLLPVDVPAAQPGFGAYPLDLLIRQLEDLPVKRVILMMDACFSGLSTQGSLVPNVSGAFGVAIAPPQERAKVSVLTATDFRTPQFAHWLDDKEHGAFSWFVLEGLKGAADHDGDGLIHLSELRDYVDKSLAMRDLVQSPSLMPGSEDSVLAEFTRGE